MGIHGWYALESILSNNIIETPQGHAVVLSGCQGISLSGNSFCGSRVGIYCNKQTKGTNLVGNSFEGVSTKLDFAPDVEPPRRVGNIGLD